MVNRKYWLDRIEEGWRKRPIVWLAGVRRSGKTTLARMLSDTVYLNCDLPSTQQRLEEVELFFQSLPKGSRIILDEIHRLKDPSRILKIAADAFSHLRILATGSSTLAATRKFRDSLTGRKTVIFLLPVLWTECRDDFNIPDLDRRMLRGGLPEPLLADRIDPEYYSEWLDSFYARDIQELFGIRERTGFLHLLRVLLGQSGGLADYSSLSRQTDMARPTVKAHIEALTVACAIYPLRPFHGGRPRELLRRPKVYGFDTGFASYCRGWREIREEDRGILWEHLVLDGLRSATHGQGLGFWRDKSGREIDFVIHRDRQVDAIECKINPDRFDPEPLRKFREAYPDGRNFVVCPGVEEAFDRSIGGRIVHAVGCRHLFEAYSSTLLP
jgi:predicted AAA+ superfamily ATPase